MSIHHLNTKLWGNYEQTYMYSTRTIFAVKLVAVEALLYKERTRSQHAHCSKVNGQASSRQLCIGINITSHQPKDFCPAEVFPQNLSKTCNSPAVGVTKVAINTELMLIVKFSFFLYVLCKSRTKALCVWYQLYRVYNLHTIIHINYKFRSQCRSLQEDAFSTTIFFSNFMFGCKAFHM